MVNEQWLLHLLTGNLIFRNYYGESIQGNTLTRAEIAHWRQSQLELSRFQINSTTISDIPEWSVINGRIAHKSGGFFSVAGLRFQGGYPDSVTNWQYQPIILQPEVGILGFLLGRQSGRKSLLLQAKTEPGNPNGVQLAPTFQCTESNFRCLHGGERAPFYEYFDAPSSGQIVSNSLQSEQGTRFFGKYNRNIVVDADHQYVELDSHTMTAWRWIPVVDICNLITEDFTFNTDARSVLASCNWASLCENGMPFERWSAGSGIGRDLWESNIHTPLESRLEEIRTWLVSCQRDSETNATIVSIDELDGWHSDPGGIMRSGKDSIAVSYYTIQALDREVPTWSQPLMTSGTPGLVPLIAQRHDGLLRFLVQVSREPGFHEAAQISVPFQVHPGSPNVQAQEALAEWINLSQLVFDCRMSEEGGRFFQEWNRYLVLLAPEHAQVQQPAECEWLTLGEINALKQAKGMFTNEFRSALSLLLYFL